MNIYLFLRYGKDKRDRAQRSSVINHVMCFLEQMGKKKRKKLICRSASCWTGRTIVCRVSGAVMTAATW